LEQTLEILLHHEHYDFLAPSDTYLNNESAFISSDSDSISSYCDVSDSPAAISDCDVSDSPAAISDCDVNDPKTNNVELHSATQNCDEDPTGTSKFTTRRKS
jgi:hypothetical protein